MLSVSLAVPLPMKGLGQVHGKTYIVMADFNRASAFELAQLDRAAMGSGDKKDDSEEPWQKIKTDRQLVAIGKALGAQLVISNDKNVRNNALRVNIQAMTIQDLELPESARQMHLVPPIKALAKGKQKRAPLKVIKPATQRAGKE